MQTIITVTIVIVLLLLLIWIWWQLENKETITDQKYLELKSKRDELAKELDRISNELHERNIQEMDSKIIGIHLTIKKIDYLLDTYIK